MANARQHQHPKLKKYVVVKPVDPTGLPGIWAPGEVVRVDPLEVPHYIAGGFIVPLDVAIRNGLYDPTTAKPSLMTKVSQAAFGPAKNTQDEDKPKDEEVKTDKAKALVTNPLSEAVQAKKAKSEETKSASKSAVSADKLAAIKAGGK